MKITNVKIRKVEKENSKLKGVATVIIDDCFAIHDIRIIEGKERLFVAMPSRKTTDNSYVDIAHPINHETRKMFEEEIWKKLQTENSELEK